MRKRKRENPSGVCGHYHKYKEGEVCGICGHRAPVSTDKTLLQVSAFPSEISPDFLYLGSYDNASCSELSRLRTVPACQSLYKNSFTYHCLQDDKILQFDDAIQFLVSLLFVLHSEVSVNGQKLGFHISSFMHVFAVYQQLLEYEQKLFGSSDGNNLPLPTFPPVEAPSFNFGFSKANDPLPVPIPAFNNLGGTSIFARPPLEVPPYEFRFSAC